MRRLLRNFMPGILGIVSAASLLAQPPLNAGPGFGTPPQPTIVYYEAINLASEIPGRSRLDVLYRFDLSFFIAVRAEDQSTNPFTREGDFIVELLDSSGHAAARDIERFIENSDVSEIQPSTRWHEGILSFDVPPGSYTIAVTVEDHESNRQFSENSVQITARDFPQNRQAVSIPFFISISPDRNDSANGFRPMNGGGGMFFGEQAAFVVQITNPSSGVPVIQWSCSAQKGSNGTPVTVVSAVDAEPEVFQHSRFLLSGKHPPSYEITRSAHNYSLVVVRFPSEKLNLKRHKLTVTIAGGTDSTESSLDFDVIWPGMPRSLRNPDYALDVLRYITTDDELDSLRSGTADERREHLEQFWAKKDHTPETAFNEVMSEYYTRVDHASVTFSTLRTADGSFTDRGRIYILYGMPSKTERKLDPSGFMEIWSYESAGKKFIFLDDSKTGNYVLTSTQPL